MKKTTPKATGKTIAETVKDINARFGEDTLMKLDQKPKVGIEAIPTGSFGLDIALGIGGLPRGRIVEVFGPESSGKTTLALHVIAQAQAKGGACAFIDAEHAMDPEYAKRLGVVTKELLISQPSSGEQGLEILESIVRSGKFAVVVVDSVATLTPQAEIEGDMGDAQMGRHARLMSQALRKLVGIIAESKTLVIFINQIRVSLNSMPGSNPEYTPGGKALKFYASVRLDIRRIATIKKGDEPVGSRTRVKVVKNKVSPPFKKTEFDIMYGEGISQQGEILATGELMHVIQKSGSSYNFGEVKLGRGYDASRQFLKEHQDIELTIRKEIIKRMGDENIATVEVESTSAKEE